MALSAITVLALVQRACGIAGVPSPSSLTGSLGSDATQTLGLLYETVYDLRSRAWWPHLRRKWAFFTKGGQRSYQLPQDFYSFMPNTGWDPGESRPLLGPYTDPDWARMIYGTAKDGTSIAFRVRGGNDTTTTASRSGQFEIDPASGGTVEAETFISFDYSTSSCFRPTNWAASTVYAPNAYATLSGSVFKVVVGGTSSATYEPFMINGISIDGSAAWRYIFTVAWASSTPYDKGDYATTGGRIYKCTNNGISGSVAPSHTSGSATDGTVTWLYISTSGWSAETDFADGAYVTSVSELYQNITSLFFGKNAAGGTSGKQTLQFTSTTVTDGTITWQAQPTGYVTIAADTDLCLFDEDLVSLGLIWRIYRQKGLRYEDRLQEYETAVQRSVGRWGQSFKGSFVGSIGGGRSPYQPSSFRGWDL